MEYNLKYEEGSKAIVDLKMKLFKQRKDHISELNGAREKYALLKNARPPI